MVTQGSWVRKRFDAVIIGAGISGLCTGAILANNGKKVLVVEKCDSVGGRGRCMAYGGYTIANGYRSQTVEYVNKAKELSGARFELKQVPVPVLCFYNVAAKKYFEMPDDMATQGIEWVNNLGLTDPQEVKTFLGALHGMLTVDAQTIERFNKDQVSFKEYVTKQVPDPKLQKALFDLTTYSSHGIFDWERFAAGGFFTKILPCLAGGDIEIFNGVPTDQAIVDGFAEVIREKGGEIKLLTEAKKIVVTDGKVSGVVIQDNYFDTMHMAESGCVVSSLPVWQNLSILNRDLLPKAWKENAEQHREYQGFAVGVFYGLRKKVTDMTRYIRLLAPHAEIGTQGKYEGGAFFLSNTSPGHAPDGKQLFFIERFYGKETEGDWDAIERTVENFRKWTPELFETLKAQGLCSDSFADVVEMEKVGVHQPSWGVVQWTTIPNPEIKAPGIEGLYFIGDTVKAGAWGYDLAAASGVDAAEMILAR